MDIMKALLDYIDDFEKIGNYKPDFSYTSIEWLDAETNSYFSIVRLPIDGDGTIRSDVLGNKDKVISISINALFDYNSSTSNALQNHKFFSDLQIYIEENNRKGIYPVLDKGYQPMDMSVVMTPSIQNIDPSGLKAVYSMTIQFRYKEFRKK